MHPVTLRVTITQVPDFRLQQDAERPGRHSHAERGNDQTGYKKTDSDVGFFVGNPLT
jgi:hypothetical protein